MWPFSSKKKKGEEEDHPSSTVDAVETSISSPISSIDDDNSKHSMTAADADANAVTESDDDTTTATTKDDNFPTMDIMESVVRCTLAGLGGSIVGLSQEKHLQSMRVVAGAAATAAARRKRSSTMFHQQANLPLTWAISCISFCAIIETCRWTSPSTQIWKLMDSSLSSSSLSSINKDGEISPPPSYNNNYVFRDAITSVADVTIGGGVAGIAGAFGRRTRLQKRLPSAMLRGATFSFGVGPGLALGLAAGILQATTDFGLNYAERAKEEYEPKSKQRDLSE